MEIEGFKLIRLSAEEVDWAMSRASELHDTDLEKYFGLLESKHLSDRDLENGPREENISQQEYSLPIIEIPYTRRMVDFLIDAIRAGIERRERVIGVVDSALIGDPITENARQVARAKVARREKAKQKFRLILGGKNKKNL